MASNSVAVSRTSQAATVLNLPTWQERIRAGGAITALGRLSFAAIFLLAGLNHFSHQTIAYAANAGVPFPSIAVPLSGAIALLGGLSIMLGYRARLGAWLIVIFLIPVTVMMHSFWTVNDPMMAQMQVAMFMKNLSMLGGALLITQLGAGPWSLDTRRSDQQSEQA